MFFLYIFCAVGCNVLFTSFSSLVSRSYTFSRVPFQAGIKFSIPIRILGESKLSAYFLLSTTYLSSPSKKRSQLTDDRYLSDISQSAIREKA